MRIDTDYRIDLQRLTLWVGPNVVKPTTEVSEIVVDLYCQHSALVLHAHIETAQRLFDALWREGLRPSEEAT